MRNFLEGEKGAGGGGHGLETAVLANEVMALSSSVCRC